MRCGAVGPRWPRSQRLASLSASLHLAKKKDTKATDYEPVKRWTLGLAKKEPGSFQRGINGKIQITLSKNTVTLPSHSFSQVVLEFVNC